MAGGTEYPDQVRFPSTRKAQVPVRARCLLVCHALRLSAVALVAVVLLARPAAECAAQTDSARQSLTNGARVRLQWSVPGVRRAVGNVVEVRPVGFLFQPADGADHQQVEFSALSMLEVSTGSRRNSGAGFLIGFFSGVMAGVVVASGQEWDDIDPRPITAAAFGLGGGLLGAIIGRQIKTDRWAQVTIR